MSLQFEDVDTQINISFYLRLLWKRPFRNPKPPPKTVLGNHLQTCAQSDVSTTDSQSPMCLALVSWHCCGNRPFTLQSVSDNFSRTEVFPPCALHDVLNSRNLLFPLKHPSDCTVCAKERGDRGVNWLQGSGPFHLHLLKAPCLL